MKRILLLSIFFAVFIASTISAMPESTANPNNGVSGYSSGNSMLLVMLVLLLVGGVIIFSFRKKKQ